MIESLSSLPTVSLLAGGLVMSLATLGRSYINKAFISISERFLQRFTICLGEDGHSQLVWYISTHPSIVNAYNTKIIRTVKGSYPTWNRDGDDNSRFHQHVQPIPAKVSGYMRVLSTLVFIKSDIQKDRSDSMGDISITVFTLDEQRAKSVIEHMLNRGAAHRIHTNRQNSESRIKVPGTNSNWTTFPNTRDLSKLYLKKGLKEEIIRDLTEFMNSPDLYYKRGTPWRRNYMFHGPSGTGKTSLVLALANHFKTDVSIVQLSTVVRGKLAYTLTSIGTFSFVLIEDADRDQLRPTKTGMLEEVLGPSLSELFQAFDGPASTEAQIIFINTNNPDAFDKDLLRPGRIDREFYIGLMEQEQQVSLSELYYDTPVTGVVTPIKPAAVQQVYQMCKTPQQAQARLEELANM